MKTLGVNGAKIVHDRFQTDDFKKYVKLKGLKFWEGKHPSTIHKFLDKLLRDGKIDAGLKEKDGLKEEP